MRYDIIFNIKNKFFTLFCIWWTSSRYLEFRSNKKRSNKLSVRLILINESKMELVWTRFWTLSFGQIVSFENQINQFIKWWEYLILSCNKRDRSKIGNKKYTTPYAVYTVGLKKRNDFLGSIVEGEEDFVATFGVNNTLIYSPR